MMAKWFLNKICEIKFFHGPIYYFYHVEKVSIEKQIHIFKYAHVDQKIQNSVVIVLIKIQDFCNLD